MKSPASEAYMPSSRRAQKKSNSARNPWTPREDAQLLELMTKYGQSWAMIASCLSGRTGKQVRDRFLNKLRPGVRCGDWSNAEDELVVRLMKQVGHRWSFIATHLPGRTEVQVKNRFYSHIKKRIQPDGAFCQSLSISSSNATSSLASSETLSNSAASPSQDPLSYDYSQDYEFDIPTENVSSEQNITYNTVSQASTESSRVDPADMISYEFPISEFCRQFSQPNLFKMTSFQLFHEVAHQAPQRTSESQEADSFLFQEQTEKRNASSLELEAERLSELTRRKALLERALAQTMQELNVAKH
jgi:hypothetical protein